nr:S9 family peptidase [Dongshaea marina]
MHDTKLTPPIAAKHPYTHENHGHHRQDDYFWLRDDERKACEVLDYLHQENSYTEQALKPLAPLQQELYREMVARQEPELESVPYFKKGYWYQSRFTEGEDYRAYYRHKGELAAPEELIIDCNQRAQGHDYYQLGDLTLSANSLILAYSEDTIGRRQYKLRFKNLQTGEALPDEIENISECVWANDNQHIFYVRKHPQTLLPYQVYLHCLGSCIEDDLLVYEELNDTFYTSIYKTRSEQYLVIAIESTTTSEVRLIPLDRIESSPEVFLPRSPGHEYRLDHFRGKFYILSNQPGKNFALLNTTGNRHQDTKEWTTLIEARQEILLEHFELMQDWLIVEERSEGLPRMRQIHLTSGEERNFEFNDPTYNLLAHYNPVADTNKFRYQYVSMTTPSSIYELDLDSGERQLLKQSKVMGNFDSSNYKSERLWISVRDNTRVPVSLVYHKNKFNHQNPLLLYGYGAYGHSLDADFSSANLSLLDRGFVYAIAHVRGGEELGRNWYDKGRLLHKQNSFNDFIDVSRGLVDKGYAAANKLMAMGGSAGGLLMGAVINQAPELYKAVIAAVPFVDVVSTMLDESIPLTTGEYDEWGNPNYEQDYHNMLSYSPYDQVKAQNYPHLLVSTGLHDSQVQYWEPAKWVAKLRELKTDDNQLLLYTDMDAGHSGKSGRFKHFEDTAREFAFLLHHAEH